MCITLVYTLIEAPLIKPLAFGKITLANLLHVPAMAAAIGLAAVLLTAVTSCPPFGQRPATLRRRTG